jgi:hypothetical protein
MLVERSSSKNGSKNIGCLVVSTPENNINSVGIIITNIPGRRKTDKTLFKMTESGQKARTPKFAGNEPTMPKFLQSCQPETEETSGIKQIMNHIETLCCPKLSKVCLLSSGLCQLPFPLRQHPGAKRESEFPKVMSLRCI